jgi:hypothetical protein
MISSSASSGGRTRTGIEVLRRDFAGVDIDLIRKRSRLATRRIASTAYDHQAEAFLMVLNPNPASD